MPLSSAKTFEDEVTGLSKLLFYFKSVNGFSQFIIIFVDLYKDIFFMSLAMCNNIIFINFYDHIIYRWMENFMLHFIMQLFFD